MCKRKQTNPKTKSSKVFDWWQQPLGIIPWACPDISKYLVFLALQWPVVGYKPGPTQHLGSTPSPGIPCKTTSFDDIGTYNKGVTVPVVSHWGDSSLGYLIKGMSEIRMVAELERTSNSILKGHFLWRNAFCTCSYMYPLLKYPISNRTNLPDPRLAQSCPGMWIR